VNATTPREAVDPVVQTLATSDANPSSQREVFDPAVADFVVANIFLRDDMTIGQQSAGPAVIVETETTIIVPSSRVAVRQPDGCIDIRVKG
jgi:N-methylhydantoinase A